MRNFRIRDKNEVKMKKIAAIVLSGAVAVTGGGLMSGCKTKENKSEFDYGSLYKKVYEQPFPEQSGKTSRAMYGYTLKNEQGYNGWYYMYSDGGRYFEMTFGGGAWSGGGASLEGGVMRSSNGACAVRKFVPGYSGEAVIYGNFRAEKNSSSARIYVAVNGEKLYEGELSEGDFAGKYFEVKTTLSPSDCVYIGVSGEKAAVYLNPAVTFENSQDESLYHLTAAGKQYGDVFPYYDINDNKLYMGFLWSDDARTGNYGNALEVSSDMLHFTDIPEANNYDIWQKYKQEYRLHYIYDCNKFIDRTKYTYGIRDNFLYFDEENQRYLMIGGAYYRFDSQKQTSDLIITASDDALGFSWTKPATVVEEGYDRNLPECPSLMKIGDRWYVFVSVAYVTAHQVGALRYWTGDKGVDCLDVDWSGKDYSYLDGEDLCAARPTQVGEKVYMWGWIPSLYDGMPWSPWGGYLNLPREVIARSDGSLGGRLDPALKKLLNYGNIYSLGENSYTVESGTAEYFDGTLKTEGKSYVKLGDFNRTYTTFTMKLKNGNSAGYLFKQGGKEYRMVIERENGKQFMKVLSPDDSSHKVNSVLEIAADCDLFDIEIVSDGEFTEFFVNGEYALTAHTAMRGNSHSAYLYSDGGAEFSNVRINKLVPYGDI